MKEVQFLYDLRHASGWEKERENERTEGWRGRKDLSETKGKCGKDTLNAIEERRKEVQMVR